MTEPKIPERHPDTVQKDKTGAGPVRTPAPRPPAPPKR